jgi:hypothetical protein
VPTRIAKDSATRLAVGLAPRYHRQTRSRSPRDVSIEESPSMADHSPYQRKIIDRYYRNFDAIKHQKLSELATELYLAEGKKRDRLWARVMEHLRSIEFPETRIAHLDQKRDPALLVEILSELDRGSKS